MYQTKTKSFDQRKQREAKSSSTSSLSEESEIDIVGGGSEGASAEQDGIRRRKVSRYSPDDDVELHKLTDANYSKKKNREKMSRWDKFVDAVDEYTRPISNSMVYRSMVASDICTAYKPFEIFKSYFAKYTTGLSLAYLIVSIAFIVAYMEILWARSVYGGNQQRADFFRGAATYNVAIPTLTGVAVAAPNYYGDAELDIALYICEVDASGITFLQSDCELKNLTDCTNYVKDYGLSQAAYNTLDELQFLCPQDMVYIANNAKNLRNQKYMTITIEAIGNTEQEITDLLESGAQIYWMGANFMPDENKLPDEEFVVNVFSVITSGSAGHYRFAQRYRFWEAKLTALSYYNPFETVRENWLVFEGSNLGFTNLKFTQDPVTQEARTILADFLHTPLPLAYESAIKYYGYDDYATQMAGLVGFLFILVGAVIKLYNRWSYRGDGHCGVCKGSGCSQTCFKGQSHGGVPFASKIAWTPYMESIFSREQTLDPVGRTLLRDKLDSYGSEYDLWKQVSDLTEECHAAKMRLKKTLHTSAMLEDL